MRKTFFTILLFCCIRPLSAQLTVVPSGNGTQLAQLIAGSGVQVSNVTFSCGANGAGTFSQNGTNLNIPSGVVITSGNAAATIGNVGSFASTDNAAGTDANLSAIAAAAVQDVCRLEFDFVPIGNAIQFSYVWGSEEYPEWVNSGYNDAFGFFVTGPIPGGGSYNGVNIALIPNTNTPVTIDNVNAGSNNQYFINNQTINNPFISYDGMTTVLTATLFVVPCATYRLKLAVGDVGDGIYDSGIFLASNSLTSSGSTVSSQVNTSGFSSTFEGCVNGQFNFTLPSAPFTSTALNYTVTGTATNGTDFTTLPGVVYFSPGQTLATVPLIPLQDGITESVETVIVNVINPCDGTILSSSSLTIGDFQPLNVNVSDSTLCSGQSVSFQAQGTGTFSWSSSPPGGGLNATNIPNPTATPTQSTAYTVSSSFAGCVSTSTVQVIVSNPVLTASTTTATVCLGDTLQLQATVSGGQSPVTYAWSPAGAVLQPSNATTGAVLQSNTNFTVTATDAFGCIRTQNVSASVFPDPNLSVNGQNPVCPGTSTTISTSSSFSGYSWNSGETTATIQPSIPGLYWADVVTQNGCSYTTDTFTLQQFTVTSPTLGPDTTLCDGQSFLLQAAAGQTAVVWNNGVTGPSLSVTVDGLYSYSSIDGNGCPVQSDTIAVNFVPVFYADLSPDTMVCPGQSVTYTAIPGVSIVVWSNGTMNNSQVILSTSQNLSYTALNAQGCPVISDTISFEVRTLPVVDISSQPSVICANDSVLLSVVAQSGVSYTWSPGGSTDFSLYVTTAGMYYVTGDDGYCPVSDSLAIAAHPNPPVTLGGNQQLCPGNAVTLSPSGSPFVTYLWSDGSTSSSLTTIQPGTYQVSVFDGLCPLVSDVAVITNHSPVSPQAFSDTVVCAGQVVELLSQSGYTAILWNGTNSGSTLLVSQPGQYSYTALDVNQCPVTSNVVTVTHTAIPEPIISALPPAICAGEASRLSVNAESGVSYLWAPGGQSSSGFSTLQPGWYYVTATTNIAGCSATDSLELVASPDPQIELGQDVQVCCLPAVLTPQGGAGVSYMWSDGSTDEVRQITSSGTYQVTATNAAGCTATDDIQVSWHCLELEAATAEDTITIGNSTQLSVTPNYTGDFSYLWTPGSSLDDSLIAGPVAQPVQSTLYAVIGIDQQYGCTDTAWVRVSILIPTDVAVPDAFTPNGDGLNDVFWPVVVSSEQQRIISFRVYNRWGQIIHDQPDMPWDGTFDAIPQPVGTYMYYLQVESPDPQIADRLIVETYQGSVTLIR